MHRTHVAKWKVRSYPPAGKEIASLATVGPTLCCKRAGIHKYKDSSSSSTHSSREERMPPTTRTAARVSVLRPLAQCAANPHPYPHSLPWHVVICLAGSTFTAPTRLPNNTKYPGGQVGVCCTFLQPNCCRLRLHFDGISVHAKLRSYEPLPDLLPCHVRLRLSHRTCTRHLSWYHTCRLDRTTYHKPAGHM